MTRCVVVVRPAAAAGSGLDRLERAHRAALLRDSFATLTTPAFFSFLFSELCLQCVVLAGAVLFIFVHASLLSLLLLPPVAALLVYVAVSFTHHALADKLVQSMMKERRGFVAEVHGPLPPDRAGPLPPDRAASLLVLHHSDHLAEHLPQHLLHTHKQVIGTVSMGEWWGGGGGEGGGEGGTGFEGVRGGEGGGGTGRARLFALAVHPLWCGRGVGRALVAACSRAAQQSGMHSVEAITSELQQAANNLFYRAGWSSRGSYHRRLAGAALTLLITQYGADLHSA